MGVREQIVQLRSDALDEVRYAVGERNRILQEKAQIEGTLRASIAAALEVGLDSETLATEAGVSPGTIMSWARLAQPQTEDGVDPEDEAVSADEREAVS